MLILSEDFFGVTGLLWFLGKCEIRDGFSESSEKVPGFRKRDRHCLIKCLSSEISVFLFMLFDFLDVNVILDETINFLGLHVFKANILS